jgi:N-acetylmuramoyl-L-alanine amidase
MFRRSQSTSQRSLLRLLSRITLVLLLVVVGGLLMLGLTDAPTVANWLAGTPEDAPLVGLIAGHWQNDSGAVCPDGLQEVELTLAIARKVAHLLRQQGVRVEVLPEFSPKLNGYRADALVSIHCDSCIDLSGFKVARMTHSSDPEGEDRLVELLYEMYAQATGLQPHHNTITEHMREYHALRRIAPETPGAIIECGFMGGDRHLLTMEQDRVAAGIANGIMAFLRERRALPNVALTP